MVATLATVAERCRQERLGNPAVMVVGPVVAVGVAAAQSIADGALADGR